MKAVGRQGSRRPSPFRPGGPGFRRAAQGLCLALFLVSLLYVCWPYTARPSPERVVVLPEGREAPAHYALDLARKERLPAEVFLWLDPLGSLAAAVASRRWHPGLLGAAGALLLCLAVPRWFCSYACPLGTVIDLGDGLLRVLCPSLRPRRRGPRALRFMLLVAVMVAAAGGVLLAGFVAAIPILARGLASVATPVQVGLSRGWHNVPPVTPSLVLAVVWVGFPLLLGLFSPRFWCRYVCPSGALLSLPGLVGWRRRRLGPSCTACGRCHGACPFAAVRADHTADPGCCTFCRTCQEVCPSAAVSFGLGIPSAAAGAPDPGRPALGRRDFLAAVALGGGAALAIGRPAAAGLEAQPLRPPGSLPEPDLLDACIRCGQCLRACPNNVLQPGGLALGLGGLWTPVAVPDWSGCDPSCNNCGQVCPTGAIRAVPLLEKRAARMGLAEIDRSTCLPWAGTGECELCADECRAAGYDAIEFERVGVVVDEDGFPTEGSGRRAPVMVAERCVGCGLCQSRCYRVNRLTRRVLERSAIRVIGGPGREDRLRHGSYRALREEERQRRLRASRALEQSL